MAGKVCQGVLSVFGYGSVCHGVSARSCDSDHSVVGHVTVDGVAACGSAIYSVLGSWSVTHGVVGCESVFHSSWCGVCCSLRLYGCGYLTLLMEVDMSVCVYIYTAVCVGVLGKVHACNLLCWCCCVALLVLKVCPACRWEFTVCLRLCVCIFNHSYVSTEVSGCRGLFSMSVMMMSSSGPVSVTLATVFSSAGTS